MPPTAICPDESELLKIAMDEPVEQDIREHVDGCAECRSRVARFRAEAASLMGSFPDGVGSRSTERDPDQSKVAGPSDQDAQATEPRVVGPEDVAAARERAERQSPVPDAIGGYKVVGLIDTGGEADVYRVVHIKLGNDLVLKLAHRRPAAADRARLEEQGRLLVDLEHPNLVRIYDLDFHEERPYLVMEYVHGRNLEDYARDEPVTPRRAAELVAKLAAVMSVAHKHGIIHCDIKPKNILIDKLGEPRIIDFGMAHLRHAWTDLRHSTWGGTVAYMAPEQARLEVDRIGPRSDIFALGGVLYFLLTGQPPYSGETADELWHRARRCDFEAGALGAAKVPRELERVCLKAMSAEPADRYATAEAFQNALKRYLAAPKVRAMIAGVVGVALMAILGYRFVMPWIFRATPPEPTPTVHDRDPGRNPIPTAMARLKGRIDLLVVKSKDGKRVRLRLEDQGSVPVKAADEIRIEARIDRPAYLYLFWISSDGAAAPLYPWQDRDWSQRPAQERRVKSTEVPEIVDQVMNIPVSPPSLEALVLLAREDSPLPRDLDSKLAAALSATLAGWSGEMKKPVWIEDGEEVVFETAGGGRKERGTDVPLTRGIPSKETRQSDDPVLGIRRLVQERIQPLGGYSQAVLFPNDGG
jgi:serine/threonine protein kinase